MSRGGAEREGDTECEAGSRLWAVSTEPDMGLELTNCEIMTWAEVWCLTDWATQAPLYFIFLLAYFSLFPKLPFSVFSLMTLNSYQSFNASCFKKCSLLISPVSQLNVLYSFKHPLYLAFIFLMALISHFISYTMCIFFPLLIDSGELNGWSDSDPIQCQMQVLIFGNWWGNICAHGYSFEQPVWTVIVVTHLYMHF